MQSTLSLKDTDPHDIFMIEPEVVRALRASKSSSDVAHDAVNDSSGPQAQIAPDVSADAPSSRVEPTFRATTIDDIKVADEQIERPGDRAGLGKFSKGVVMGLFALTSAMAAAAWQHYGDTARTAIVNYAPPFVLAWSRPAEEAAAPAQTSAPAVQAAATDQGAAPPAAPVRAPQDATPAATASAPDTAQMLQSMSRDLASMGQQIEQLKASIDQLKAGQDQMSRDMAKTAEAKSSGTVASEQNLRPRIAPPPPMRAAAAPVARKPKPGYPQLPPAAASAYPQAAAVPPPQAAPAPVPLAPAPQATTDDGEPLVRPPMPVR
jgi:hypothetical protein